MRRPAISSACVVWMATACSPGNHLDQRRDPVIGGTLTPPGIYPATGALMMSTGDGFEPMCSGTLISRNAVLTAAHCVHDYFIGSEVPSFTLAHDANQAAPGEIVAGLSKHAHESFDLETDPPEGVTHWYDIGLVILASDITWVPFEILPTPAEAAGLAVDQTVELVGYGLIDLDTEEYGVKYNGAADLVEVGDWELWISKPGQQQNCYGDSGGPALVDLGGGLRLVGTVSRSPDNEPVCDHGGIDTRVDGYLAWIHDRVPNIPCGGLLGECVDQPDAGPSPDGGVALPDAGPPADAHPLPDAPVDANRPDAGGEDAVCDDGDCGDGTDCSCRVGDRGPAPSWPLLFGAAAILLARRRRAHRPGSPAISRPSSPSRA